MTPECFSPNIVVHRVSPELSTALIIACTPTSMTIFSPLKSYLEVLSPEVRGEELSYGDPARPVRQHDALVRVGLGSLSSQPLLGVAHTLRPGYQNQETQVEYFHLAALEPD